MCRGATTMGTKNIPAIAKRWLTAYDAVPQINVPLTNLNVSFVLASATFLLCFRLAAEQFLTTVFNWPEGHVNTKMAAASMISICHSLILVGGLLTAFRSCAKYSPSERLDAAPLWWQQFVDAVLQFCTGYMVYDAIYNVYLVRIQPGDWVPTFGLEDYLFLAHHMITATYMTSARVVKAGYMSAMMCMLLGEITNPVHNSFFIAEQAMGLDCCNGAFGQKVYSVVEVAFAASYFFTRVFIAPIGLGHVSYDLTRNGRKNKIPLGLNILWNFMIWAVIFGSYFEIAKCYSILKKTASWYAGGNIIGEEAEL
jgi:hypothetical protein